jgi:hypothetical protein
MTTYRQKTDIICFASGKRTKRNRQPQIVGRNIHFYQKGIGKGLLGERKEYSDGQQAPWQQHSPLSRYELVHETLGLFCPKIGIAMLIRRLSPD